MIIQVFSTKDGLNGAGFQIQRALHHFTPSKGYTCHLELLAAKMTTGAYEAKTAPSPGDLGLELGAWRRRQQEALLNNIQTRWI